MEPQGSSRGLGVTTKSLQRGTERVMMPVEGLRIAEGESNLQKSLTNCYRQIEFEVASRRAQWKCPEDAGDVLGERSGQGIGISLGVCLVEIKELKTRGSNTSHKGGQVVPELNSAGDGVLEELPAFTGRTEQGARNVEEREEETPRRWEKK